MQFPRISEVTLSFLHSRFILILVACSTLDYAMGSPPHRPRNHLIELSGSCQHVHFRLVALWAILGKGWLQWNRADSRSINRSSILTMRKPRVIQLEAVPVS
jgi:hypothetical protein